MVRSAKCVRNNINFMGYSCVSEVAGYNSNQFAVWNTTHLTIYYTSSQYIVNTIYVSMDKIFCNFILSIIFNKVQIWRPSGFGDHYYKKSWTLLWNRRVEKHTNKQKLAAGNADNNRVSSLTHRVHE